MENAKELGFVLNPLLEAQRKFSVIENRLFYLGLQDINPHLTENDKIYDEQFPNTHITPSELKKIFGYDACLTEIAEVCEKFTGTTIKIKLDDGFDVYSVFSSMKYRKGKGLFIKFNEDMRKILLDIYKLYKQYGFTKLEIQQVFYLNSSYAMRLLELLLKYRSIAKNGVIEREISMEDLRVKLNVPEDAYKGRINNFRQFVLDKPIKDINKNTKYFITYKTVKEGRYVTGFKFFCNCNNVSADDDYTETIEHEKEKVEPVQSEQVEQEILNKLVPYGFSLRDINKFVDICGGVDELARRLEYGEKKVKEKKEKGEKFKTSETGFLRRAIEDNWLAKDNALEMAKRREIEAVETNREWEQIALKMFSNEPAPVCEEKPFNLNDYGENYVVKSISKKIREGRGKDLDSTERNALQSHGYTILRFMEVYMEVVRK